MFSYTAFVYNNIFCFCPFFPSFSFLFQPPVLSISSLRWHQGFTTVRPVAGGVGSSEFRVLRRAVKVLVSGSRRDVRRFSLAFRSTSNTPRSTLRSSPKLHSIRYFATLRIRLAHRRRNRLEFIFFRSSIVYFVIVVVCTFQQVFCPPLLLEGTKDLRWCYCVPRSPGCDFVALQLFFGFLGMLVLEFWRVDRFIRDCLVLYGEGHFIGGSANAE